MVNATLLPPEEGQVENFQFKEFISVPLLAQQPILDLHVLNQALQKLRFKMLMQKRILTCVSHQDWFAAT